MTGYVTSFSLAPWMGIALLLVMIFSGRAFRENWKAQGPQWQMRAWAFGLFSLVSFLALALIPLQTG